MSLFIGLHGIYSEVFLMRRLLTDFRGGDLFGRCRYPLRLEKVPQISQIYTDFYWDVFLVTQISQMTQIFYSSDYTEFIRRFPVEAITHGFSQRRPVRSVQIPPKVGKSPTDFTDIHRFFLGRFFSHADFADDADFFIHRMTRNLFGGFPAEAINHGFSRRLPIRSVQIPTESGICPTDFTDIHRFFIHRMTRNLFGGFPDEAITHGFSQRRPIRSVQIPTESGQRDSTEIPLKICVYL